MNATTTRTLVPVTFAEMVKGATYTITTMSTPKAQGEVLTGSYRGTASTGYRFKVDGKVVTRAASRIIKVEQEIVTTVAPAEEQAPGADWHVKTDGEEAPGADWYPEIAAETEPPAEFAAAATGEVTTFTDPAAPTEATEDASSAAVQPEPTDAGDDLDSMKFAQLMELAKLHKVPGRGVARIQALRDGIRRARREAEEAFRGAMGN